MWIDRGRLASQCMGLNFVMCCVLVYLCGSPVSSPSVRCHSARRGRSPQPTCNLQPHSSRTVITTYMSTAIRDIRPPPKCRGSKRTTIRTYVHMYLYIVARSNFFIYLFIITRMRPSKIMARTNCPHSVRMRLVASSPLLSSQACPES